MRIKKTYIYGMRLRGFSLGTQPMKGLIGVLDAKRKAELDPDGKYHDLIEYTRKLSKKELKDYELDLVYPKKSKYNNRKVMIDGHEFDSIKEGERYKELKLLERAGKIKNLELQPKFELLPTIRTENETLRQISYFADFKYEQDGETVVEDVKGCKTDVYKLKKRIFLLKYGKQVRFFENYM